ncbi:hypothetical protein [Alicyclobacillus fastidiosus]|uniref:Uncharacterized protein n=1 Tax=Alicyclobacillus fastidiosus TaxID=392011 RepID=A0ABV5AKY3_9BACL
MTESLKQKRLDALCGLMIEEAKVCGIDPLSFIQLGNPLCAADGRTRILFDFNAFFAEWAKKIPTERILVVLKQFAASPGVCDDWHVIFRQELECRYNNAMAGVEA